MTALPSTDRILRGTTDMSTKTYRDSVLVIDDDEDCRTLIGSIAQSSGLRVLEASDCRGGLSVLEREHDRIKMVILDYFMPGMEPKKCAAAIIAKAGPLIPVVLLTAAVDARARAAELKISRWISKPFEPSALTSLLTQPNYKL